MAEMFTTFSTPDPESWLPEPAASRLKRLKQRAVDARQLLPDRGTIDALRIDKSQAEQRLARLRRSGSEDGFAIEGDSHPAVRTELRKLAAINSELSRLLELDQQRSDVWTKRGQLLSKTESWLRDGRPDGTAINAVESEPPSLKKGQSIFDAVEAHRLHIRGLKADLHHTRSACFPSVETKRKMVEWVDGLAAQGAPDVSRLVELFGDIAVPTQQVTSHVFNVPNAPGAIAFAQRPDTLGFVLWLFRDQVISRLDAEIAAESDDGAALGERERAEQEAAIMADMLAVERQEVELILSAEAEGLTIEFRSDTSPQALLGVELVNAMPAAPATPSFLQSFRLAIGSKE